MKLIKMSFIKFLILGFVLVFAKNVFAQMPTDKESVSKIFSAINTLSGNFEFVYELDIADEKVKNGGQFYFQKPSKLKWVQNYQQKTGFLMDGQKVVFWKVDTNGNKVLEDISKKSFARRFATFLYAFVSMDFDVLQKAYDVEFRDDRIVFLPKKNQDAPKNIEVFYNEKGEVDKVLFYAKNGDLTTIIFTNVKINEALPEDAFSI